MTEGTEFPYIPCPLLPTHTYLTLAWFICCSRQTCSETLLSRKVYIRIQSWHCTSWVLTNVSTTAMSYGIVHCSKKTAVLCLFIPSFKTLILLLSLQFSDVSECHIVGIIQYVVFSGWFLLFNNMHLKFLPVFSWMDRVHFLFVLNNIPLSGCTTVYLSAHQLKDILVASKFC